MHRRRKGIIVHKILPKRVYSIKKDKKEKEKKAKVDCVS